MKKKYSKVNTSSRNHRKFQTSKEKINKNKKKETKNSSMNNSVSVTPVQGPSTVVCMSDLTTTTSPLTSSAPYVG
jgi:hypothetical protein